MKIYLKLEAPYEWARVKGNTVEAFGEVETLSDYPIDGDYEVVGVVPGEWITTHIVTLPAKTRKQFNLALPFALEESISEDVNNIHFVCQNWRAGEPATVFSVAKDKMKEWQNAANDHRLPVAQLMPDHALLPFHEAAECSVALTTSAGEPFIIARRPSAGGVSIDAELLDVWLMDVPLNETIAVNDEELAQSLIAEHSDRDFRHWPFGDKMRHWLEYEVTTNVDLWAEQYRPRVSRVGKRMFVLPALVVILAICLKFGFDGYRYVTMKKEIAQLDQQMVSILQESFPDVQGVGPDQARQFMEAAIQRGQVKEQATSIHTMLAQAAAVLKRQNAQLIEVSYLNEELVLKSLLNDFSQVDALTKQFNDRPNLVAALQDSSAEDGKVEATYSLKRR